MKDFFVTQSYKNCDFTKQLNDINFKSAKIISMIIMVLELIMITLSLLLPSLFKGDSIRLYQLHFLALLVYAFGFYVLASIYDRYAKKHVKILRFSLLLTVIFGLFWGASISVMDLKSNGTMSVYLTFTFMLSAIIITRPDLSLIQLISVQSFFLFNMPNADRLIEVGLNSSVFILFAWVLSREHYKMEYNRYLNLNMINDKSIILERQNDELIRLTETDHLTGLYNRYNLQTILKKLWVECYLEKQPIHIFMIDIDYFKKYNDTYGHLTGDRYLVRVAEMLIETTEKYEGFAFRYGGDEFCLLFMHLENPEEVVKGIHKKIHTLKIENKLALPQELSIGVYSEIPESPENEWKSVDLADQALYRAKANRNRRETD